MGTILKNRLSIFLIAYYLLLFAWWIFIFVSGSKDGFQNNLFGALYAVIPVVGGIYGLIVARRWGGWSSVIGRGISFLSLGLLAFAFGQFAWSYYNMVLKVEVPYPSVADIGYVSTIPLYFLGMFLFAKAAGAKYGFRILSRRFVVAIIPIITLGFSYWVFLRGYEFDFSNPLRILIDFGYPLGQALTISVALVALLLSKGFLGGIMKLKIQFLIFALAFQYITDFYFLYGVSLGTYYNAGPTDLMYATSFLIMSLGLISFNRVEEHQS